MCSHTSQVKHITHITTYHYIIVRYIRIFDFSSEPARYPVFSFDLTDLRFNSLRKRHVMLTCQNAKARPRHETINLSLYTESRESKFTEFLEDQGGVNPELSNSKLLATCK